MRVRRDGICCGLLTVFVLTGCGGATAHRQPSSRDSGHYGTQRDHPRYLARAS